jgi:hypothetical protein
MTKADGEKSFLDGPGKGQVKKRKCLYHPALQCPTPNEPLSSQGKSDVAPCCFTRTDAGRFSGPCGEIDSMLVEEPLCLSTQSVISLSLKNRVLLLGVLEGC